MVLEPRSEHRTTPDLAIPSTSTAPFSTNTGNSSNPRPLSKRPRTVSPRTLEALKVKVAQDKMSGSMATTSSSDLPLDLSIRSSSSGGLLSDPYLAKMAFLADYPNTSFSLHPLSEAHASTSLGASSEVLEASEASTSFLVAPNATILREMMPEERTIKLVFSSDRPDLPFPRVELVETPTTGSPTPSTSTSSQ